MIADLPSRELLTPKEVAAFLRVGQKTIYEWISTGKIECVRLPGKAVRIPRRVIVEMMGDAGT